MIGTVDPSGDVIFGPGNFGITTISALETVGAVVQNLPLDAVTQTSADLTAGSPTSKSYTGSLALVNNTTPLAVYTGLFTTYWRVWTGQGDVNDAGTWGPEGQIAGLATAKVAGGKRGVFL